MIEIIILPRITVNVYIVLDSRPVNTDQLFCFDSGYSAYVIFCFTIIMHNILSSHFLVQGTHQGAN